MTDRRDFFKQLGQFVLSHKVLTVAIPGGALGLGLAEQETKDLTLRQFTLPLKDWPKELNGYKIVQLSDLHLETLQISINKIAAMANSLNPDLLVITGDIASSRSDLLKVKQALAPLKAKDGKFAVFGNNDYDHFSHTQFTEYVGFIRSMGYDVLLNAAAKVTVKGKSFWIVGVDDPATAHDDVPKAFAQVRNDGLPRIVLAHSTDCIDGLYGRDVDLLLTGHTHGGQIKLPFIGPPIRNTLLAQEGIYAGFHVVNGINVYISRGIGTSVVPLRIGVRPEVTGFTLVNKSI